MSIGLILCTVFSPPFIGGGWFDHDGAERRAGQRLCGLVAGRIGGVAMVVTQQYLLGELRLRLDRLRSAASCAATAPQIAVHWREEEYYRPPAAFVGQANAADPAIFERFVPERFPECFKEYADLLDWDAYWHTTLDTSDAPFWKWFVGGKLNACYNCVDRRLATDRNKAALIPPADGVRAAAGIRACPGGAKPRKVTGRFRRRRG